MKTICASLCVLLLAGIAHAEAPAAPDLKAVQAILTKQIELIKADNITELKKGFVQSMQDGITAEVAAKAKKTLETMKLEEIAASVTPSPSGKAVAVKMANGRTLTSLELVGEQWLFTKIWFK